MTRAPKSVSFVDMVCLKLNVPSGLKLTSATTPDRIFVLIFTISAARLATQIKATLGVTIELGQRPFAAAWRSPIRSTVAFKACTCCRNQICPSGQLNLRSRIKVPIGGRGTPVKLQQPKEVPGEAALFCQFDGMSSGTLLQSLNLLSMLDTSDSCILS